MNSKPTTDVVCGMRLCEGAARWHLVYDGRHYYFCSVGCWVEFERHPQDYADVAQQEEDVKSDV